MIINISTHNLYIKPIVYYSSSGYGILTTMYWYLRCLCKFRISASIDKLQVTIYVWWTKNTFNFNSVSNCFDRELIVLKKWYSPSAAKWLNFVRPEHFPGLDLHRARANWSFTIENKGSVNIMKRWLEYLYFSNE